MPEAGLIVAGRADSENRMQAVDTDFPAFPLPALYVAPKPVLEGMVQIRERGVELTGVPAATTDRGPS